jgi:hypothetical protein
LELLTEDVKHMTEKDMKEMCSGGSEANAAEHGYVAEELP